MSDSISRQAAIDALDKRFDNVPKEQTTEILLLRKDLRELPSEQPERKIELQGDESAIEILSELRSWFSCFDEKEGLVYHALSLAIREIKANHTARPERKKGIWDFIGWQMFQCSECKHTFTQDFLEGWREYTYESHFPPFCPNCGANMREGDSE